MVCFLFFKVVFLSWKNFIVSFLVFIVSLSFPIVCWFCFSVNTHVLDGAKHPEVWAYFDVSYPISLGEKLSWELFKRGDVAHSAYIAPKQGLVDFEKKYDISAGSLIDSSPLPGALVVNPKVDNSDKVAHLVSDISTKPGVSQVKQYIDWKLPMYKSFQIAFYFSMLCCLFTVWAFIQCAFKASYGISEARELLFFVMKGGF